jgi:hypothetical protein
MVDGACVRVMLPTGRGVAESWVGPDITTLYEPYVIP